MHTVRCLQSRLWLEIGKFCLKINSKKNNNLCNTKFVIQTLYRIPKICTKNTKSTTKYQQSSYKGNCTFLIKFPIFFISNNVLPILLLAKNYTIFRNFIGDLDAFSFDKHNCTNYICPIYAIKQIFCLWNTLSCMIIDLIPLFYCNKSV